MSKIVIFLPDAGEVVHELTEDRITVGRVDDNAIQIADASVSTHHAEFILSGGEYALRDLNSTNGSRINGKRVTEAKLCPGDRIRFGSVEGVFEPDASGTARPLPPREESPVIPADQSQRPEGFGNASPFVRKSAKKDTLKTAAIGVGIVALLAGAVVIFLAFFNVQPPAF